MLKHPRTMKLYLQPCVVFVKHSNYSLRQWKGFFKTINKVSVAFHDNFFHVVQCYLVMCISQVLCFKVKFKEWCTSKSEFWLSTRDIPAVRSSSKWFQLYPSICLHLHVYTVCKIVCFSLKRKLTIFSKPLKRYVSETHS